MKRAAIPLVAVLAMSACGHAMASHNTPRATPTTSPATSLAAAPTPSASLAVTASPSTASSPTPSASALTLAIPQCSGTIPTNRTLVLSPSISSADETLFDVGDPSHPKMLCTISNASGARFLSATQIAYEAYAAKGDPTTGGGIAKLDLSTGVSTILVSWGPAGYTGTGFAFSPDGKTLAYTLAAPPSSLYSGAGSVALHFVVRGTNTVVATLPGIPGRGGSEDDDYMLAFSPDGAYAALVETFTATGSGSQASFQIRRADGTLVLADPPGQTVSLGSGRQDQIRFLAAGPFGARTMAVWSGTGSRLFYRDAGGVYRWDPTLGTSLDVPNVSWLQPHASPDGKWIAYMVRDSAGLPHIWLHDIAGGTTTMISQQLRSGGVFLTPSILWLQEEQLCSTNCGMGPPTRPTGTSYLYDLNSRHETPVQLGLVVDVWPR